MQNQKKLLYIFFLSIFIISCAHNKVSPKLSKPINTDQKVIIITGTASGLGKATAKKLIKAGHKVYGFDINKKDNQYLNQLGGYSVHLDVRDSSKVFEAVDHVFSKEKRLDVLINNAGILHFGPIEEPDMKAVQNQFNINFFGYVRLQNAVLPYMRKKKAGRIINISSALGKFSFPMIGWYSATKHAVEGMSDALKLEVKPFNIEVIKIQPGAFKSNLTPFGLKRIKDQKIENDYKTSIQKLRQTLEKIEKDLPTPDAVVDILIEAINAKRPKSEYRVLNDAHYYYKKRRELSNDEFYERFNK